MRHHFKYLPEFLELSFKRADSTGGVVAGSVLLGLSFFIGESILRPLGGVLTIMAVIEGTYAAFHHERIQRERRERVFYVSCHAAYAPQETRPGGWLTEITASATVRVRAREQPARITACWLAVYQHRRTWKSLFFRHRELVTRMFGLDKKPMSLMADIFKSTDEVPAKTFPITIQPGDPEVVAELEFRTLPLLLGPNGKRVDGHLDYEIQVDSESPDATVTSSLWWSGRRYPR